MPKLRRTIVEVALAFGGLLVGATAVGLLRALALLPVSGPHAQAVGFLVGPAITGTAALVYFFVARRLDAVSPVPERADPAKAGALRSVIITVVGIVVALVGSIGLGELMTLLRFPVEEQASILEIIRKGVPVEIVLLCFSAVALAPIAEECLFRGLLFRRLLRRSSPLAAYGLSAIAFAAIHPNPAGFVVYAWLGLVFATTLRHTGRLWTAVAVHAGNNALALVGLLYT